MKIITYNVLDGFLGDGPRKQRCAQWIKSQQPDVVTFNELNGFTSESLSSWCKTWGHEHSLLFRGISDYYIGITSSEPFLKTEGTDEGLLGHGLLHVITWGLNVMTTHLSPHSSKRKVHDVGHIIERLETIHGKGEPYLFTGDLNSHHPSDRTYYDSPLSHLEFYHRQLADKRGFTDKLVNDHLDYRVSEMLEAFGAVDLVSRHGSLFQSSYGNAMQNQHLLKHNYDCLEGLDITKIKSRIDYIWADPFTANACKTCYICDDKICETLSDHNPIIAELEL